MRVYIQKRSIHYATECLINKNKIEDFIDFMRHIVDDVQVINYGNHNNKYHIRINALDYNNALMQYKAGDKNLTEIIDDYFSTLPRFQGWEEYDGYLKHKSQLSYLSELNKPKLIDNEHYINIFWE